MKPRFVVHDHFAKKAGHHHDFRLELDGILKSWVIPKGVPEKTGIKRLAIEVEDHPACLAPFIQVEVPTGKKTIKENFSSVLSYDFQNEIVDSKKVTASSKRLVNSDAITLYFHQGRPLKKLCCTLNHEIFTQKGKEQARHLKEGDFIFVLKDTLRKRKKELILGMLLGDAGLWVGGPYSNTASIYFEHSIDQKDYLLTKCRLLGLKFYFQKYPAKTQKIGKYIAHFKPSIRAISKTYPFLYDYHLLCYKNGIKTITKEWLDKISEVSLAYFFLDDGSLLKENKGKSLHAIEFSTQSFSKEEQLLLKEVIEKKFGLKANLYPIESGTGWYLRVSSIRMFLSLIYPWIPPQIMTYKLGRLCSVCGNLMLINKNLCPNCILEKIRKLNYPSESEYKKLRYENGIKGPSPKSFWNLFGRWGNVIRLAKQKKLILPDKLGGRYKEIENEEMIKEIGLAKIRDIQKSWNPKRKYAFDIQVQDTHNFFANGILVGNSYINFEGVIEEGQYGAGKVEVWDKGTYVLDKRKEDEIIIRINGKKLKGRYCLIKFKGQEKNWLFFKC